MRVQDNHGRPCCSGIFCPAGVFSGLSYKSDSSLIPVFKKTVFQMVIYITDRLQMRITNRCTEKFEAPLFHVLIFSFEFLLFQGNVDFTAEFRKMVSFSERVERMDKAYAQPRHRKPDRIYSSVVVNEVRGIIKSCMNRKKHTVEEIAKPLSWKRGSPARRVKNP